MILYKLLIKVRWVKKELSRRVEYQQAYQTILILISCGLHETLKMVPIPLSIVIIVFRTFVN